MKCSIKIVYVPLVQCVSNMLSCRASFRLSVRLLSSRRSVATLLAIVPAVNAAGCPFLKQQDRNMLEGKGDTTIQHHQHRLNPNERQGDGGIPEGGYDAVRADIAAFFLDSQDFFHANFEPPIGPNYGGLMILLAWHCNGS